LAGVVPNDHSRQIAAEYYVDHLVAAGDRVLDVGCGPGASADLFLKASPTAHYIGADLEWSPAIEQRRRIDVEFITFDGVHLPLEDGSVDGAFSKQVFEHVRHPQDLLADIVRVLRPGGLFAGSTSQLEPYHSLSFWNYTPHGLRVLFEAAGLEVLELRPGIDSVALIGLRALELMPARLSGQVHPRLANRWWRVESPVNRLIELRGRMQRMQAEEINLAKLLLAGQIAFLARRPDS
jgi:SAM-dependent methyltransferase